MEYKLFNRELSWLSFNYRVLQEAKDPDVPLYEKIKFLAIFSSNLDEFFRVRVASLRSLLNLKKKTQKELDFDLKKLLDKIQNAVVVMQEEYGKIFTDIIYPELKNNNIYLVNETELNEQQREYAKEIFEGQILPHIMPMIVVKEKITPFLRNQRLYLAVKLSAKDSKSKKFKRYRYAIVEIPNNHIERFILLPKSDDKDCIIFLDDILRLFLPQIFYGYYIHSAFSVKLTRDAELYIEDEFSGNLIDKIKKSLSKRGTGVPCRFQYDREMPASLLKFLKESLLLTPEDLFPAARYLSFNDFFSFPNPGKKSLNYPSLGGLKQKEYSKFSNVFDAAKSGEYLFNFPYHTYDHIVNAINTAAKDPDVKSIKITQYRVGKNSNIVNSLIKAAHRGKDVTAFVEVKARFDEEVNIRSAEEMQKAGIKVLYSLPGLKVHAKMALISRLENGKLKDYAYLATGNFNELTTKSYTDFGFITTNKKLTKEVNLVFDVLEHKITEPVFEHLLVAQFNMRKAFNALIENEIKNANEGKKAAITAKMNNLEDEKIIRKLYEASNAGVKIKLIVRGICCLIPGIKGMSENISVISIVDRLLEHGRIFVFHNAGNEQVYLSSADWMKRNLSRRIEVAFPVYNSKLKTAIKEVLEIQFRDNVKARIIDEKQTNRYRKDDSGIPHRSQYEIFEYWKTKD
jgi:polyphosphate kinase